MRMLKVKTVASNDYTPIVCRTDFVDKLCRILQESGWIADVVDADIVMDIPALPTEADWMYVSETAKLSSEAYNLLKDDLAAGAVACYDLQFCPNNKIVLGSNERVVHIASYSFIHDGHGILSIQVEVSKWKNAL